MDKMEFQRGNPQEDRPKRIAQKKKRRKWLALVLVALVAVTAVVTALLWDATEFDGLRRKLIYAKAEKDETGCVTLYRYPSEKDSCFALLEGSLVRGSTQSVAVFGEDGTTRYSADVKWRKAAVCANEKTAAVYDVGGTDIYVLSARGLVRHMQMGGEIIACTINEKDMLAVTVNKSGYKASVEVYSADGEKVFAFHSSDRFLMSAAVAQSSKQMAAVTMSQTEGEFLSSLVIYELTGTEPVLDAAMRVDGAYDLGAVYDLGTVGQYWCAVGENGLLFLTTDGKKMTTTAYYDFEDTYLRRCALSDDFATVLLGRHKSGMQARLVTVDEGGLVLGEVDVEREVLSVSAAGRYVAVLYSDELVIYDRTLQVCARLSHVSSAKRVLMRADGSAVLVGADSAKLYLP